MTMTHVADKIIRVANKMNRNAAVIKCGTPLTEVVELFNKHHINSAPVVNKINEVIGLVAASDSLQALLSGSYYCDQPTLVNDVMTKKVTTISPQDTIIDVAIRMKKEAFSAYPVTEKNVLVGMLTRQDILQVLAVSHAQCGQMQL